MVDKIIFLFPELDKEDDTSDNLELLNISREAANRLAEFEVAAELCRSGFHDVKDINTRGYDLFLDRKAIRVQVKSTLQNSNKNDMYMWTIKVEDSRNGGQRALTREDCDIVALYHHLHDTTIFMPISEVAGSMKISLPARQCRTPDKGASLRRAIARIENERRLGTLPRC